MPTTRSRRASKRKSDDCIRSAEENPTSKRDRQKKEPIQLCSIPPVINGVRSTSKTPICESNRDTSINIYDTNDLSLFFSDVNNVGDIPKPAQKVKKTLESALENKDMDEDSLRNAVYTELLNHGIEFPQSASKKGFLGGRRKKYNESDLSSLLDDFGNATGAKKMQRIMRGLPPLTTTSKPDMTVYHAGPDGSLNIIFGEFKNSIQYSCESASTQCVMYLVRLLYWLRAVNKRRIKTVYGFYFCGCQCKRHAKKSYSVGLVKLSAPDYLGEVLTPTVYHYQDNVDSLDPLYLLIHFLKSGRCWEEEVSNEAPQTDNTVIPSLLHLPIPLWDNNENRKLIPNATEAIVFRLKASELRNILDDDNFHIQDQYEILWEDFKTRVYEFLRKENTANKHYYLKIRSKDSCGTLKTMLNEWKSLNQKQFVKDTYPIMPYGDENIGVLLMNDCGHNLDHNLDYVPLDQGDILSGFEKIADNAIFLSTQLPHGDVLPHNIVCNEEKTFTLIDIDGGVDLRQKILQRKIDYSVEGLNDWYAALSYPNAVFTDPETYTKIQLMALFEYLSRNQSISNEFVEAFLPFSDQLQELGKQLMDLDKDDKIFLGEEADRFKYDVKNKYETMMNIIKEHLEGKYTQ